MSDVRENQEEVLAVLGQDFGSLHSKLALVYYSESNQVQVSRIQFQGRVDDPDYPETNSEFQFAASAAPRGQNTNLVGGKAAEQYDTCIPLKTMVVCLSIPKAWHRKKVVSGMHSGPELLEALHTGKITTDMIRDALTTHFQRLRKMALLQANSQRVRVSIAVLALTYPNYLFEHESQHDSDRYMELYLELIRIVWGPDIKVRVVSKGQAGALHLCQAWFDTITGTVRQQVDCYSLRVFSSLKQKQT
ncbi:hypothetical protein INS49_005422 [Diaporthe citri]|uniref:uncharacterized protein n=1 Tax=Diaporthe citri TaxID=83186 RepID=UPI001C7E6614|nr:uncharacterized protein INS49_005422 [Diaporthe citri]KAG6353713.1 hypothetical protein INS49_005422 [Diaporthe citri]